MTDLATLTKKGDVSIIKLDDGKANAFSLDMLESLNACLAEVSRDSGSLIITGREGLFSAGFDLKTLASGDVEAAQKMVKLGFNTLLDLYSFPRPIVAAISGHAVALGIFVACCCDYRIGIEGKFICQANEVRNNMDIPVQIMEIVKDRLDKKHFYKGTNNNLYHSIDLKKIALFLSSRKSKDKNLKLAAYAYYYVLNTFNYSANYSLFLSKKLNYSDSYIKNLT